MTDAVRWDTVAEIRKAFTEFTIRGSTWYQLKQYLLVRTDGTMFVLDNSFAAFQEMGAALEQEVVRHFLPGAIATYRSGSPVYFEVLSVSQQGIYLHSGQNLLPWHEFKGLKIENGQLTLKKHGSLLAWASIPIADMPNLCVFEALTEYITDSQE